MSGRFVAEARCPALQSIKQKSNPGTVSTDPGRDYTLLGRNSDPATHYYLEFPGAEPDRRWVAIGCGRIEAGAVTAHSSPEPSGTGNVLQEADAEKATRSRSPRTHARQEGVSGGGRVLTQAGPSGNPGKIAERRPSGAPAGQYILAASWHPSFCEGRPNSRDCRSGPRGSHTRGFVLHGFWPQPRGNEYCGVSAALIGADRSGPWRRLPQPRLSPTTRRDLERVMPGAAADLERHEWLRHGTCYGADADRYFGDAVDLIDALNASAVAKLFVQSVGSHLTSQTIRTVFDDSFGRGAGRRVEVECAVDGGRRIITELRVALRRSATSGTDLGRMIAAGSQLSRGCAGGIVDPAGAQ